MKELMDNETYDALRMALANAHPEDFINLIETAIRDRADTEYATSPNVSSAHFIVPAYSESERDRRFTVEIRFSDI